MKPMTKRELLTKIGDLPATPPLTVSFEQRLAAATKSLRRPWYASQQEHWQGWLKEYDGPGAYGRATWNVPARKVYNRVVNPAMVLWLGEAAGIRKKTLTTAIAAADRAGAHWQAKSAAIRRVIPWDDIEQLL